MDRIGFFDPSTLTLADGWSTIFRRARWGLGAIRTSPDFGANDPETDASDVVSNILTALFGPAGVSTLGGSIEPREFAVNEARRFIERAFSSWEGDAEDYTRKPEPGEYGYEEATT